VNIRIYLKCENHTRTETGQEPNYSASMTAAAPEMISLNSVVILA